MELFLVHRVQDLLHNRRQSHTFFCERLVKVLGVQGMSLSREEILLVSNEVKNGYQKSPTYHSRLERRIQLSMLQLLPIHCIEEAVVCNISQRTKGRAQSYTGVLFQQLKKKKWLIKEKIQMLFLWLTALTMFVASLDRYPGIQGVSLQIDQNSSSSSQPLNGLWPISISYNNTPNDHQSTVWLYFWPWRKKKD